MRPNTTGREVGVVSCFWIVAIRTNRPLDILPLHMPPRCSPTHASTRICHKSSSTRQIDWCRARTSSCTCVPTSCPGVAFLIVAVVATTAMALPVGRSDPCHPTYDTSTSHDKTTTFYYCHRYCTGGVRCERASLFLQQLLQSTLRRRRANGDNDDDESAVGDAPLPEVYQLRGGIQRYLEDPTHALHYKGKNFVFDPRRTDPPSLSSSSYCGVVGQCGVCHSPHDDYDNGVAPSRDTAPRCVQCRSLLLVCPECRPRVQCWGDDDQNKGDRPRLTCGGLDVPCLQRAPELLVVEGDGGLVAMDDEYAASVAR